MSCMAGLDGLAVQRAEGRAVAGNDRHLAVFQEDHAPGMLEDGRHVGGDEHLAIAETDRHAAGVAQAGRDQRAGLAAGEGDDRARSPQLAERQPHGLGQRAARLVVEADEVHDHFGVGVRPELDAFGFQLGAQLAEVLHDAVLHDHHLAGGHRRAGWALRSLGLPWVAQRV